jgi:hypothetical protein
MQQLTLLSFVVLKTIKSLAAFSVSQTTNAPCGALSAL